jgi:amino acid permease
MNRGMRIAAGISVLFTTLGFSHIIFHNTMHLLHQHEDNPWLIAAHSVVAIALVAFSLVGAFSLLAGPRSQKPS